MQWSFVGQTCGCGDAVVGARCSRADCSARKKPGIGAWFAAVVDAHLAAAKLACGWQCCFGPFAVKSGAGSRTCAESNFLGGQHP